METAGENLSRTTAFNKIFCHTRKQIISGAAVNWLTFFNILGWSILAALFGFWLFGLGDYPPAWILYHVSYGVFIAVTPVFIGLALFFTHASNADGDRDLKITGVSAHTVLIARGLAVFVQCFLLLLPWMLIFALTTEIIIIQPNSVYDHLWLRAVIPNLTIEGFDYIEFRFSYDEFVSEITPWQTAAIYSLFILQIAGWMLIPVASGLLMGALFRGKSGGYFLAYFAVLLIPASYIFLALQGYLLGFFGNPSYIWVSAILSGLGGIVIALIFYSVSVGVWRRRTG